MRLLELAHVDGDDVLLAAVERLGQRERGLGLADAARCRTSMNTPIGLFGLSSRAREVWMRLAIMSRPCSWPMTRLPSVSASSSTVFDLVLHHAADRDAGPVGDHAGDRLRVDRRA